MTKTIRTAIQADLTLIDDLIRELAIYEKMEEQNHSTPEALRKALFGDTPTAHALIAELDGVAVGVALYFFTYSTFQGKPALYLEDLYVRPTARGTGMGKLLLKTLAQIGVDHGCGRMAWVVLDWNEPSIQFYKSIGAEPKGEWLNFHLVDGAMAALADS